MIFDILKIINIRVLGEKLISNESTQIHRLLSKRREFIVGTNEWGTDFGVVNIK